MLSWLAVVGLMVGLRVAMVVTHLWIQPCTWYEWPIVGQTGGVHGPTFRGHGSAKVETRSFRNRLRFL